MPTTFCVQQRVSETPDSPKSVSAGLNSTKTRTFEIYATSEAEAFTLLRLQAPSFDMVDGIPLEATPVYKLETVYATEGGVRAYKATVDYRHAGRDEQAISTSELIEPGREKVTSSFTGTTASVTTAIAQTKYGAQSRDVGKAVNVQYNGEVEGHDINVRTGSFTVSTVIHKDVVTNAWLKDRFEQIWTINNATFRGWEVGCVALTGMDTRQRADGHWEIDYTFAIQPQERLTEIGGVSLGGTVVKEGFQYTWVMFRPKDDTDKIVPEPIGAYIATVYNKSDFGQLGIQE